LWKKPSPLYGTGRVRTSGMPPLSVAEMRRRRLARQEKENREKGLARGHKTQFDLDRERGFEKHECSYQPGDFTRKFVLGAGEQLAHTTPGWQFRATVTAGALLREPTEPSESDDGVQEEEPEDNPLALPPVPHAAAVMGDPAALVEQIGLEATYSLDVADRAAAYTKAFAAPALPPQQFLAAGAEPLSPLHPHSEPRPPSAERPRKSGRSLQEGARAGGCGRGRGRGGAARGGAPTPPPPREVTEERARALESETREELAAIAALESQLHAPPPHPAPAAAAQLAHPSADDCHADAAAAARAPGTGAAALPRAPLLVDHAARALEELTRESAEVAPCPAGKRAAPPAGACAAARRALALLPRMCGG